MWGQPPSAVRRAQLGRVLSRQLERCRLLFPITVPKPRPEPAFEIAQPKTLLTQPSNV
jgi:hypothetical protein